MKNAIKTIALLFAILITSCKKPLDYYNKAVSAGNMSISLHEMESRIQRIQEGYTPEAINLAGRIGMRVQFNESQLTRMKELLGNNDSDPMMQSAIACVEHDIACAKNPKSVMLFNAIDKKLMASDLPKVLEPFETYLDSIYDVREVLWKKYNEEVSKYAKANDIEETFYGPDLQPIKTENK